MHARLSRSGYLTVYAVYRDGWAVGTVSYQRITGKDPEQVTWRVGDQTFSSRQDFIRAVEAAPRPAAP